ncbi:MAG: tRNA pseudouridine(55) synthase TruB [Acidimicrobiia bacterium]
MRDGLVIIDKPAGWTSHDVVAKLRGVYGQRRIGHTGTLDPDATGVLVVALGRATRLVRYLQLAEKSYEGEIAFGVATDTLDASGAVLERAPMQIDAAMVEAVLPSFLGEIQQLPPMVSAVKVAGQKLYEAARRGETVERTPRTVRIDAITLEEFTPGPFPRARITVTCGSGTYIRALASDIGVALGGCAHLAHLRRTSVGGFTLTDAHALDGVIADPDAALLPIERAAHELELVTITQDRVAPVQHGMVFPATALIGETSAVGPFAVLSPQGVLLAVYERRGNSVKPSVVLAINEA